MINRDNRSKLPQLTKELLHPITAAPRIPAESHHIAGNPLTRKLTSMTLGIIVPLAIDDSAVARLVKAANFLEIEACPGMRSTIFTENGFVFLSVISLVALLVVFIVLQG